MVGALNITFDKVEALVPTYYKGSLVKLLDLIYDKVEVLLKWLKGWKY